MNRSNLSLNKEKYTLYHKEYHKKYSIENKDKIKRNDSEYYQKNKDKLREKRLSKKCNL